MELRIEPVAGPAVGDGDVEIVERKGLGHPDTICDSVSEAVSQALVRAYRDATGGHVLHHNCDKGCLLAGQTAPRPGGGDVLRPMRLIIGDRATVEWNGQPLPVDEVAVEAARQWIREHLPRIDPDRHLEYQLELRPGSPQLTSVVGDDARLPVANDTSVTVGYAPLSETEQMVLAAEHWLNSSDCGKDFPEVGEDVKVMGVRVGGRLDLTVAAPLVDSYLTGADHYLERKQHLRDALESHMRERLHHLDAVGVRVNHLDNPAAGLDGLYLTVLGTSAEHGDSGQVGRGNDVAGIIAMRRPRSSEAAAGKNPVSHVGKIYSVLAHRIADAIHRDVDGVREATVYLCSRIGQPLDDPWVAAVTPRLEPGADLPDVQEAIDAIVRRGIADVGSVCRDLIAGTVSLV